MVVTFTDSCYYYSGTVVAGSAIGGVYSSVGTKDFFGYLDFRFFLKSSPTKTKLREIRKTETD